MVFPSHFAIEVLRDVIVDCSSSVSSTTNNFSLSSVPLQLSILA